MESKFKLTKTRDTISIWIGVKPKFYAYLLGFPTILLFVLPYLFYRESEISFEKILLAIIYLILVILLPLKYFLWNILGSENLVITRKSISFRYNYGFFSNNFTTIPYEQLKISFLDILNDKNEQFGKLHFYDIDGLTDIPKSIHNLSIYISKTDFDFILREIEELLIVANFSLN